MSVHNNSYLGSSFTKVHSLNCDDSVSVVVQVPNEFFEAIEATNTTFETAFRAFGTLFSSSC